MWKEKLDGPVVAGLAIDVTGLIYAATHLRGGSTLHAIDPSAAAKARIRWKRDLPGHVRGTLVPHSMGGVLVTTSKGSLQHLAADGAVRFTAEVGSYDASPPTVLTDGTLVVRSKRAGVGVVVVGIAANGEQRFEHPLAILGGDRAVATGEGAFYLPGGSSGFEQRSASGEILRTVDGDGRPWIVDGLALAEDGSVVVTSEDPVRGGVGCFSPKGELRWFAELPSGAAAQPLVCGDGTLLVRGRQGTLLALTARGGTAWSIPLGDPTASTGGVPLSGIVPAPGHRLIVRVDAAADPEAGVNAKQACELVALG